VCVFSTRKHWQFCEAIAERSESGILDQVAWKYTSILRRKRPMLVGRAGKQQGTPRPRPWVCLLRGCREARALVSLALVLVPMTVRCGGDGFRADELACLRASVKISTCCPRLPPLDSACEFQEGGGCAAPSPAVLPALTEAQGECLEAKSCAEYVAAGMCEAVRPDLVTEEDLGAAFATYAGDSADVSQASEQTIDTLRLRIAFSRRPLCR
jgi:hypothetical protein